MLIQEKIEAEKTLFTDIQKKLGHNCLVDLNDMALKVGDYLEKVSEYRFSALIGLYFPIYFPGFKFLSFLEIIYDNTNNR